MDRKNYQQVRLKNSPANYHIRPLITLWYSVMGANNRLTKEKYMVKFTGSFFEKEVLFIGFNKKEKWFCNQVYNALMKHGISVYPVSNEPKDTFEVPVYGSLDDVPKTPKCAYIITDIPETKRLIGPLHERGIEKILFNSKNVADEAVLNQCESLGIETAISCPLMAYGRGFHRFHGFLAGVKKA